MKVNVDVKYLDSRYEMEWGGLRPATPGSAAVDLRVSLKKFGRDTISLDPGHEILLPTGVAFDIKTPNVCFVVLPKSGLGAKSGIVLGNLTGLIDNDYQGEIMIKAWYRPKSDALQPFKITDGMFLVQGMFLPYYSPIFNTVDVFEATTERGSMGFGEATKIIEG